MTKIAPKLIWTYYGTWEALDRWKWFVFDAGVFLDTLASHSENLLLPTFLGAGWGTTRQDLRARDLSATSPGAQWDKNRATQMCGLVSCNWYGNLINWHFPKNMRKIRKTNMKMWTCAPPPTVPPPPAQRGVGCKSTCSYLFFVFFHMFRKRVNLLGLHTMPFTKT